MNEYKGPCEMCGKNLRKLSHSGPWVPERLHRKCWKDQQKETATQEYLLSKQQRDEMFRRMIREGRASEVDPRLRPLLDEVREQMRREDIASGYIRIMDDDEIADHAAEFARLSIQNN